MDSGQFTGGNAKGGSAEFIGGSVVRGGPDVGGIGAGRGNIGPGIDETGGRASGVSAGAG